MKIEISIGKVTNKKLFQFNNDDEDGWEAEKLKYMEDQKDFINQHNLEVGDKVRIAEKGKTHLFGWNNAWADDMTRHVGNTYKIVKIFKDATGIKLDDEFMYPYYVLRPVVD